MSNNQHFAIQKSLPLVGKADCGSPKISAPKTRRLVLRWWHESNMPRGDLPIVCPVIPVTFYKPPSHGRGMGQAAPDSSPPSKDTELAGPPADHIGPAKMRSFQGGYRPTHEQGIHLPDYPSSSQFMAQRETSAFWEAHRGAP